MSSRRRQRPPQRRREPYWDEPPRVPSYRQRPRKRQEYYDDYEYDDYGYVDNNQYDDYRYDDYDEYDDYYDQRDAYPRRPKRQYGRERPVSRDRRPKSSYREPYYEERSRPRVQDRERLERPERRPEKSYSNKQSAPQEPSQGKKIISFFFNIIFYALTLAVIMTSVMFAFSGKDNKTIFGYRFYTVKSNSMAPQKDSPPGGFYKGDMIIVKASTFDQVKEGDILTMFAGSKGNFLTHRLVKKLDELNGRKGNYMVTQGDANETKDPPMGADQLFGKVTFVIPKAGDTLVFIRQNIVLCLLFVVSTLGFFMVLKAYLLTDNK